MARRRTLAVGALLLFAPLTASAADVRVDVHQFRLVQRESGPTNYYSVVDDPGQPFIHAAYRPGLETAVMGVELPGSVRRAQHVHWKWRARVLPNDTGPCNARAGVGDEAALVYLVWKRGLKWYTLRYIWGAAVTPGGTCNVKRNMFRAEDTVVLETGRGTGDWVTEELDLPAEFRRHFAGGDTSAEVPDLVGIALMSDGDGSHSESVADYADFVLRN
jgi:hypothetical protein